MHKRVYLLIILSFLSIQFYSQGAIDGYMKAKGEADFALTYSTESYDEYWFGQELQNRTLNTESLNFFMTYGIGKNANLITSIPYIWTDSEKSLQDAILAVKYRNKLSQFDHGRLSKITSIGFTFPISDYDLDAENPIGEKAVAFQLRHLYQYESNFGYFVQLQSGIDFRVVPIAKLAVPAIFRTGWAAEKFYVDGFLDFFHTFNSGVNQTITAGEGAQFLKIGGTFYYAITPHIGVFVGGTAFLSGKNIGKAKRLNIGVVYKHF